MATFTKVNSFNAAAYNKVHNLASDQLKVALTNSAPATSNTTLSNITEITYTNLSSRNITTTSSTQSSGTYKLILADLTLTASGSVGPFRYVVIYNDTATNDELIGYADYGSSVTLSNGDSFAINFDDTSGLFSNT